jgi:hypothetical protein
LHLPLVCTYALLICFILCICSELVEHEVLPSFSPRMALTFWSSGLGSLAYRIPTASLSQLKSPAHSHVLTSTANLPASQSESKQLKPTSSCNSNDSHHLPIRVDNALKEKLRLNTVLVPSKDVKRSIFVNLASYRDTECKRTIIDLFQKAETPRNVFVGKLRLNIIFHTVN